jgi:thioredoxin
MKNIETKAEYESLIAKSNLTIIDCYADWCGPCRRIAPDFEALSKKYPDSAFYKINTDNSEMSSVVNSLRISSIPTFVIFKEAKLVFTVVGTKLEKIENYIKDPQ